ncbi:MAG: UDP-N-acetylmuramoyl-tripeptide--D-alanyl-D-alanine ligase [Candidatus Eiseniibacteriota bacterium]
MARWTAGRVARLVGAEIVGADDAGFDAVTTDSRESREGTAFFALDGTRVRGVQFVPAAFGTGCSVVVVPRDWAGDVPPGRAALKVADPREALAGLALQAREAWACPVIAVTGSSGKTTVKEMTAHVLEARGPVLRSPGNFNTVEGLARTLLEVEQPPEIAVLEVGASRPGEIARLARIVRPTAACVTNVGPAHLSGFGGVAQVAREKTDLLRAVSGEGLRVVDGDDEILRAAASGLEVLRVGFGAANDLRAVDVDAGSRGTRFRIAAGPTAELAVPGAHQVKNALVAVAFGRAHGVPLEEGVERLRTFTGVPGRLGVSDCRGVLVADDAYNANPASVSAALEWFARIETRGRRAVVLGDMLELGERSRDYHREIGAAVAVAAPALAVFVGPESKAGFEEAAGRAPRMETRWTADSGEAAAFVAGWAVPGDAVLIKGSRGMRMERVVQALGGGAKGAGHAL